MIERGKIISVENQKALVELEENAACGGCGICKSSDGKRELTVELPQGKDFEPGQQIRIEISSAETLKGGFAIFIIPLIAFLIGAVLGDTIFSAAGVGLHGDIASIICGFLFLLIALAVASLIYRSDRKSRKLAPRVRT